MAQANTYTPAIPLSLGDLTHLKIAVPAEYVLLITFNRPKHMNIFDGDTEEEMRRVLEWVDTDDNIWCVLSDVCALLATAIRRPLTLTQGW